MVHKHVTVHCAVNCQTHYDIRQAPITINSSRSRISEKGVQINRESEPPEVQRQLGGLGNVSPEKVCTCTQLESDHILNKI